MTILNVNRVAGPDGDDGRFEIQVVTADDQRHSFAPSPAAMTALIALIQADTVMATAPLRESSATIPSRATPST